MHRLSLIILIWLCSIIYTAHAEIKATGCQVNQGLELLILPNPPYPTIKKLLANCDHSEANNVQVLLLHGLLARKQNAANKNYTETLQWLNKAKAVATPDNVIPAMELAVTYEWANQLNNAKTLYDEILQKDPYFQPALLGKARVLLAQHQIKKAQLIYKNCLQKSPNDVDALNGMANVYLNNKKLHDSQLLYENVLTRDPNNAAARNGLVLIEKSNLYITDVLVGRINVGSEDSYTGHINLFADINATDQVYLLLEANTRQIGASFFTNPTLLPNKAALLGFQRQIPDAYGWGGTYEYRQRNGLPIEQRIAVNGNVFLLSRLQAFAGFREGFGSPWNNQFYYSGLTLFTDMPWNFTVTGFWGQEQISGNTSSYSFDLSKEYYHGFYDVGAAYSPSAAGWQAHGRVIVPIFKNQSLLANFEHFFFNNSSYVTAGWRVYWK